jgi:hypothetical protein
MLSVSKEGRGWGPGRLLGSLEWVLKEGLLEGFAAMPKQKRQTRCFSALLVGV